MFEWLYHIVYDSGYVYIDLWSVHHFWSGFSLIILLRAFGNRNPWLYFVIFLLLYEVIEISFVYIKFDLFLPERIKDQVFDLTIGGIGGVLCHRLLAYLKQASPLQERRVHAFIVVYLSFAFSWVWVGFNRLHFDQGIRGPGINFSLLMMYFALAVIVLQFVIRHKLYNGIRAIWVGILYIILHEVILESMYWICRVGVIDNHNTNMGLIRSYITTNKVANLTILAPAILFAMLLVFKSILNTTLGLPTATTSRLPGRVTPLGGNK